MNDNLKKCIDNVEKRFGKGAIMSFDDDVDKSIKRFSTGSIGLNQATGGGWPRGRVVELFGPESSGKTTIALHAVAEMQKIGGMVLYSDNENAFDPEYAENLGVSLSKENFTFSQPDNGEQTFEIIDEFIKNNAAQLVIVDSVAALVPKAELEGEFGESKMGLQARLMSQAMRKLVGTIKKTDTTVIFLNQLRKTMGSFYGPSEVTSGGEALKYYASIRCDIRRSGAAEKDKDDVAVSNKVKIRTVKNKTFPPFRECFVNIIFGQGISREIEILDIGTEMGIIEKKGSWFSYKKTKWQGEQNGIELLMNDVELAEEILNEINKR